MLYFWERVQAVAGSFSEEALSPIIQVCAGELASQKGTENMETDLSLCEESWQLVAHPWPPVGCPQSSSG